MLVELIRFDQDFDLGGNLLHAKCVRVASACRDVFPDDRFVFDSTLNSLA